MDWLLRKSNVNFFLNIKKGKAILPTSGGIGTYTHLVRMSHLMIEAKLLIGIRKGREVHLTFTDKGKQIKKSLIIIQRILLDDAN